MRPSRDDGAGRPRAATREVSRVPGPRERPVGDRSPLSPSSSCVVLADDWPFSVAICRPALPSRRRYDREIGEMTVPVGKCGRPATAVTEPAEQAAAQAASAGWVSRQAQRFPSVHRVNSSPQQSDRFRPSRGRCAGDGRAGAGPRRRGSRRGQGDAITWAESMTPRKRSPSQTPPLVA